MRRYLLEQLAAAKSDGLTGAVACDRPWRILIARSIRAGPSFCGDDDCPC
jgi:hypothetical protein